MSSGRRNHGYKDYYSVRVTSTTGDSRDYLVHGDMTRQEAIIHVLQTIPYLDATHVVEVRHYMELREVPD